MGGLGEELAGAGPDQPLESDGGDPKGRRVGLPEELGLQVRAAVVKHVPRLEPYLTELVRVAAHVEVRMAPVVEVLEGEGGNALSAPLAQVLD